MPRNSWIFWRIWATKRGGASISWRRCDHQYGAPSSRGLEVKLTGWFNRA